MIYIYFTAFAFYISQLSAIGAQNTFVMRCGISKKYVFLVCLICELCDIAMVSLSVFGVSYLLMENQSLIKIMQYCGAIFFVYIGISSLKSAFLSNKTIDVHQTRFSMKKIITNAFLVSTINPKAWIDTIITLGSLSSEYSIANQKICFFLGCISASATWFFALGYGSRVLIPIFQKPICWKILDFIVGIFMLTMAYKIVN